VPEYTVRDHSLKLLCLDFWINVHAHLFLFVWYSRCGTDYLPAAFVLADDITQFKSPLQAVGSSHALLNKP